MCARFLHHLRAKQWDVDSVAEKVFKEQFPETPVPDKHQQAKEFIDPLSQKMLQALEAYATPRQGDKNVEVQDLKEKLHRWEEKGAAKGLELTPQKSEPAPKSAAPSSQKRTNTGSSSENPNKQPRTMEVTAESLTQPQQTISAEAQKTMTDIKSWCSDMRSQFNPAQAKQFDKFAEKVTKLLVNHKKHELQAAAVKWGLPFPLSNSPPKTLTQFLTIAAFLTC